MMIKKFHCFYTVAKCPLYAIAIQTRSGLNGFSSEYGFY